MPREEFDRDLGLVEAEIILMGGMVESAIFNSLVALASRDLDRSQRVVEEDDRIDLKELEIEQTCVELIRREQPLAGDLRRLVAMMAISGELERIGDYAEGIAKISLMMGHEPPLKELVDIPRMGEIAVSMLKRSLEAFVERDPDRSRSLIASLNQDDDRVDEIYARVQADLMEIVRKQPAAAERATYLMWAAHNVERLADRAVNISERALYQATGELVSGDASVN